MFKKFINTFIPSGDHKAIRKLSQLQKFFGVLIFASVFLTVIFFEYTAAIKFGIIDKPSTFKEVNVAVVNIDEPITTEYVRRIINKMDLIQKHQDIYTHTLIEFNCPGGSPSASEELAYYLKDYKEKMPTTFYISSSATSGAYYAACVADKLYAAPSSFTGSIGVYVQSFSFADAMKKVGVKDTTIASHASKVPLSLFKDPTEENVEHIKKNLLDPIYNNFYSFVKEQRKMTDEELTPLAEGRVWVSSQVVGTLVDEITTMHKVKKDIQALYAVEDENIAFFYAKLKKTKSPFSSNFDINIKLPMDTMLLK
ncbi:MAG: hypothetical protein COB67_02415 [SAR324 cluster bacterium]|uniref:Peptidase S49 domain-containing protein n=1 Tax=SAR324 cluster bacterium TaxID=2024889 RepID=A0A2A4T9E7_9DELT|nr:MAG: hypothetical protein COB67_02415 [SAR324 cluster bacterium]